VLLQAQFGRVPLATILGVGAHQQRGARTDPSDVVVVVDGNRTVTVDAPGTRVGQRPVAAQAGFQSFTYRRRRPFHPARLHNLVVSWRSERVLRSKGFVWVAGLDDDCVYWSHAGNTLRLQRAGPWKCVTQPTPTPTPSTPSSSMQRWDVVGDRCQELVFIGSASMQQSVLEAVLDSCLMTADEIGPALLPWIDDAAVADSVPSDAVGATMAVANGCGESASTVAPTPYGPMARATGTAAADPSPDVPSIATKALQPTQLKWSPSLPVHAVKLSEEPSAVMKTITAAVEAKWTRVSLVLVTITIIYNIVEGIVR
jgi:hypothetical protein